MSILNPDRIVECVTSHVAYLDGESVVVNEGDRLPSTHPLVCRNPDLFMRQRVVDHDEPERPARARAHAAELEPINEPTTETDDATEPPRDEPPPRKRARKRIG